MVGTMYRISDKSEIYWVIYMQGAGCCGYVGRSYLTKEEKMEMLKEYKKELELEAKGVGERIKEMEKEN